MTTRYMTVPSTESNYQNKHAYLHREVAAKEVVNRALKPGEEVHHKDENKTNNVASNLMVFRTSADHMRFHHSGEAILNEDGSYSCPCVFNMSSKSRIGREYMMLYRLRKQLDDVVIERAIQGDEKALERLENFAYRGRKRPALVAWIAARRKQVRRNSQ